MRYELSADSPWPAVAFGLFGIVFGLAVALDYRGSATDSASREIRAPWSKEPRSSGDARRVRIARRRLIMRLIGLVFVVVGLASVAVGIVGLATR